MIVKLVTIKTRFVLCLKKVKQKSYKNKKAKLKLTNKKIKWKLWSEKKIKKTKAEHFLISEITFDILYRAIKWNNFLDNNKQ